MSYRAAVRMRSALLIAILLAACAPALADVDSAVNAEIERLEALAAKLEKGDTPLPKMLEGAVGQNKEFLARAKKAQSPLLRVYRLKYALVGLEAIRFTAEHKEATESFETFQKLWTAHQARFPSKGAPAGGNAALQRAIVQAATNHAEKIFRASLPYGKADGPVSGVYYLGDAEGFRAYAAFVASLPFPKESVAPPTSAAILSAADALDAEALKLFETDPVGRTALGTSALLKETRELLDRGWLDGATLTLLETRLELGRRQGIKGDGAPVPEKEPANSLTALWLAASKEDDRGDVAPVVHAAVLPLYESLSTKVAAAQPAAKGPVRLTLVRWPYT